MSPIDAHWRSAEAMGPGTQVIHTHQAQRYSAVWAQALFDERLLEVVEALLGPDVVLHHSKLFSKPPHTGAPFPLHQDWAGSPSGRTACWPPSST